MGILKDKVAIVTGASRGIGKSIAQVFAREGAKVVICGRKQETLDQVAREIGAGVKPVACHVGKLDQMEALVNSVTSDFGRIDILVNNAATNIAHGFCLDFDEGQFDKMVEVNLKSMFRLIKLVAPGMCDRGSGSIINVASVSGLRPQAHGLLYSMTKAALTGLVRGAAIDLAPRTITVNNIQPGPTATDMSAPHAEAVKTLIPLARMADVSEIAGFVSYLTSDEAGFITGASLTIDGGYIA